MPPLAAMGAAIGGAVSAGAAAVGGAISAGVGAIGTAVGGMTLSGLSTGLTIASTGMKLVGMATGSKTLQKIGDYGMLAGGVGSGIGAVSNLMNGANAGRGILNSSNIDKMLESPKATKAGMRTMTAANQVSSADKVAALMEDINYNPSAKPSASTKIINDMSTFDPEIEKSFWDRAGGTLTQYNPLMNMLGGMGDAYMQKAGMDQQMQIHKDDYGLRKSMYDRQVTNTSTPVNINPVLTPRAPNPTAGMLGR